MITKRGALSLAVMAIVVCGLVTFGSAPLLVTQAEAQEGGGGAGVLAIPGCTFVPESSTTVYEGDGEGGVAVTGGSLFMHAPVLLPDGARVSGIAIYFYDNHNPGVVTAYLVRNNDTAPGSSTVLAAAHSPTGTAGYDREYGSVGPTPIAIDNGRYNYQIEAQWGLGSSALRLMMVQVSYTKP